MLPVECVARGYLAGSGLAEYQASRRGLRRAAAARAGRRLRGCPSRSSPRRRRPPVGAHDENVTFAEVVARGRRGAWPPSCATLTLAVYGRGAEHRRRARASCSPTPSSSSACDADGVLTLGDEVLTPDSSRFWPADPWQPGRAQPSYDKQFVRDWLTSRAAGTAPSAAAAAAGRRRRADPRAATSRRTSGSPGCPSQIGQAHEVLRQRQPRPACTRTCWPRSWPRTTATPRPTAPTPGRGARGGCSPSHFGPDAEAHLVFNGTGANVLVAADAAAPVRGRDLRRHRAHQHRRVRRAGAAARAASC